MNIVGISAYYHDSACCLLQDGTLVAAAAEERFSRRKHDRRLPASAFRFCLRAGDITIRDIDCLAYYESPAKKRARQISSGRTRLADPRLPEREVRELLGFEGPIACFEHHQSHAASAYYFSGFSDAALFTVDGVGEWATTTYGIGRDDAVELFEEVNFPNSLGLLYSTITAYLGFRVNDAEYKVMGLAPYGRPRYLDRIRALVASEGQGQYSLDLRYFDFVRGKRMYSDALCDLLGSPARAPESDISQFHMDLAASLQRALEDILLEKAAYLHARTGSDNLCMAGGVALNCVANGRILREGPFKRLFVQPAAGDDGGCLGAAALAHLRLTGRRHTSRPLDHVFLGPRYGSEEIAALLSAVGIRALDFRGREPALHEAVVDRLVEQKVLGWFHGAMEFGPRALGARSILADPRNPEMRDRINRLVKKREAFRPFAPSVLLDHAHEIFDLHHPSPFMLETCAVKPGLDLPAITHVDGSARPQTVDPAVCPRYAALIGAFHRRTACPLLLNTSFNLRGEPIVCSPADALKCMIQADIDAFVLEDFVVDRESIPDQLREAISLWHSQAEGSDVGSAVYSFV